MRLIDADSLLAKLHNTTFGEDARPTVYRAITEEETVDAVPWNFLERYADFFCAGVSFPQFVKEAKLFYEGIYREEIER